MRILQPLFPRKKFMALNVHIQTHMHTRIKKKKKRKEISENICNLK